MASVVTAGRLRVGKGPDACTALRRAEGRRWHKTLADSMSRATLLLVGGAMSPGQEQWPLPPAVGQSQLVPLC